MIEIQERLDGEEMAENASIASLGRERLEYAEIIKSLRLELDLRIWAWSCRACHLDLMEVGISKILEAVFIIKTWRNI